jgi:hypothetical protein
MQTRDYVDLDLKIDKDGNAYVARVIDSPAGQASHRFRLPFDPQGLENFVLKLGHNRGQTRRVRSPRLDVARTFGDTLYRAVFDGEVEIAFRRSLDAALGQQKGLRVRLRVDATELAEIPWEYLYAEGLGRFVVMSSDTPLVRYLDLPTGTVALAVEPPLRVLVMVSSPSDLDVLDVDREIELLESATTDLRSAGSIEIDFVPKATLSALQQQLRKANYHVFHFLGHGLFDPSGDDGYLLLEDEEGRSRKVSGLDLGVLLHDHHSLRLAVLNACEGARGSVENPLGGVAQTLIRQGLPAAIAMQFEISDEAAIVFAHEFYLAIADGYPIDAATVEARKAIFASGNDIEWGTPVLHLRAADARIFKVEQRVAPRKDAAREVATQLLENRNFVEAVTAWESVTAATPDDEAAKVMLQRARNGVEADRLQGRAAEIVDQRPQEALELIEQATLLDADHPGLEHVRRLALTAWETAERARTADEEQRQTALAEQTQKSREAIDSGHLVEARRRLKEILAVAPEHEEAATLARLVGDKLRAIELMVEARAALDGEEWDQVLGLVADARRLDPDLEDEDGLASQAEWALARAKAEPVPAGAPPASREMPTMPPEVPRDEAEAPAPARARRPGPWLAVGAAMILVLILGLWLVNRDDEERPPPTTTAVTVPDTAATIPDTAVTTPQLPAGTEAVFPMAGVSIDGDPSEWFIRDMVVTDAVVFPAPGSEPSVGAVWLLGWDADNLFFVATVGDATFDRASFDQPQNFFRGDSVHFEFGLDTTEASGLRSGDLHVMLAPVDPNSSEVRMAINPAQGGSFVGGSLTDRFEGAVDWTDEGYTIEAAIPWSTLGVVSPVEGMSFGANWNVSDGDGEGGLEEMVSSNPDRTAGNQPVPRSWHTVVLLAP